MEQVGRDIRFLNTSSFVVKNFNRIEKMLSTSTKNPTVEKKVSSLLESIYQYDRNISQNIIQVCDNLYFNRNNQFGAEILLMSATKVISKKGPVDALELVYNSNKHIINNDILEDILTLHFHNEDFDSVLLLLDYLGDPPKFSSIRESVNRRDKSKNPEDFFVKYRTKRLIERIQQESKQDENNANTSSVFYTILATPRTLLRNYSLISRLSRKDLDRKYRKSVLGWVWAILESLALTITFLFLFEIFSTTTSRYIALNIMIGIIAWSTFSTLVNQGTTSFVSNSGLIKKLQLPKEVFLLNLAVTSVFTVSLNMIAIIPLIIYYEIQITVGFALFPLIVLCIIFYGYSLTLFTSVTYAKWRDLGRIVNVILRIGFYFTPVFFTLEMMIASRLPSEAVNLYLALNPMAILLTILRYSITGETSSLTFNNVFICFSNLILTYVLASVWFRRKKDTGVKYL